MKKLMLAAACVALATMANATTYRWQTSNPVGDGTGDYTSYTTATKKWFIDAAVLSQSDIYTAMTTGGKTLEEAIGVNYLNTADMANGSITTKTGQPFPDKPAYAADQTAKAYMVLFDSDLNAVYFSEELSKMIPSSQDAKFQFQNLASYNDVMADMSNFKTAEGGWVSVPEPTSGLLLLLGVAGLALRRRRA